MSHYGTKTVFADRKNNPVEDRMNEIIMAIVQMAIEVARPWRMEREEEERRRIKAEEERRIFEERRDRFEAAFTAWKEFEERRRFVELLEATLTTEESPSDAARAFVAWTRRYLNASEPLPVFFDELASNKRAIYRQFAPANHIRW